MILAVGWILLYVAVFVVIVSRIKGGSPSLIPGILYLVSYLLNALAPSIVGRYIEVYGGDMGMQLRNSDVAVTVHLALTLISAGILFTGALFGGLAAMTTGNTPLPRKILYAFGPITSVGTVAAAIAYPHWFVNYGNYVVDKAIPWIWPLTIDAPISYFRVFLCLAGMSFPSSSTGKGSPS